MSNDKNLSSDQIIEHFLGSNGSQPVLELINHVFMEHLSLVPPDQTMVDKDHMLTTWRDLSLLISNVQKLQDQRRQKALAGN